MRDNTMLLVIDPQNDFCDIPERELPLAPESGAGMRKAYARPALPVAGADADMKRLATFIRRAGERLAEIHVTLDTHHPVDIAHPSWWSDAAGRAPAPFTAISLDDLRSGAWRARDVARQKDSVAYVEALERAGRYRLTVWPEHCLAGSWGANVHGAVKEAIDEWARAGLAQAHYVVKGMNPATEHYSAIRAEVPDEADPATLPNAALLEAIARADTVVVAGEALSHCVANTVRDIVGALGARGAAKLVLLSDCASPVAGFEALGAAFLAEMAQRGMRTAASTEFLM